MPKFRFPHRSQLFSSNKLKRRESQNVWGLKQSLHKHATFRLGKIVDLCFLVHVFSCGCRQQRSWFEWILPHGLFKLQRVPDHRLLP
ncbi:unnamed protein product [Dovyalis caffra]|uniref:Uncharacterized protein n=1 Tax=Dovyalis caffra TaxID=77055 RepID=A0AAV1SAE0_9ROSI|nr:unnamed protein product [Dovyalis caffra]